MKRRTLLKALAAGSLLPMGLARALSELGDGKDQAGLLSKALAEATKIGKPLLVLIGPPPPPIEDRDSYPNILSNTELDMADLLRCGGSEMWRALALCQVHLSCLKDMQAFALSSESGQTFKESTWAILIEQKKTGDETKTYFRALTEPIGSRGGVGPRIQRGMALKELTERVAARSQELVSTLIGTPELIAIRAATSRAAIGDKQAKAASSAITAVLPSIEQGGPSSSFKPDFATIDMGAAIVLEQFSDSKQAKDRLEAAARARLWMRSPSGGAWAESLGCGLSYIDYPDPPVGFSCGMGFTPEGSRRFLLFYVPTTTKRTKPSKPDKSCEDR